MGCGRSAIAYDEEMWDDFRRKHNLPSSWEVYSKESSWAKEGANKGYTGSVLVSYVNKESKKKKLLDQIDELDADFEKLVELSASFNS